MPREALNKAFILTMLNRTFFGTVTEGALLGTMRGDSTLQLFREVASIRGECREAAGSTTFQKTFRDNAINRPQTTQILLYDRTYLSPCFRADEKGSLRQFKVEAGVPKGTNNPAEGLVCCSLPCAWYMKCHDFGPKDSRALYVRAELPLQGNGVVVAYSPPEVDRIYGFGYTIISAHIPYILST